nr:hypothetical protein [Tanacetum cinerariifolium]
LSYVTYVTVSSMSPISSLSPFMVCGDVDWCVTMSSLGDDDTVLLCILLIMVTQYDPYLGGAAPRAWCLQPWRVGYPFISSRTHNSEPNSFGLERPSTTNVVFAAIAGWIPFYSVSHSARCVDIKWK